MVRGFKRSPDSLVGVEDKGRRDTHTVVLDWSGELIRESL